jgi:hypothetical protein
MTDHHTDGKTDWVKITDQLRGDEAQPSALNTTGSQRDNNFQRTGKQN